MRDILRDFKDKSADRSMKEINILSNRRGFWSSLPTGPCLI